MLTRCVAICLLVAAAIATTPGRASSQPVCNSIADLYNFDPSYPSTFKGRGLAPGDTISVTDSTGAEICSVELNYNGGIPMFPTFEVPIIKPGVTEAGAKPGSTLYFRINGQPAVIQLVMLLSETGAFDEFPSRRPVIASAVGDVWMVQLSVPQGALGFSTVPPDTSGSPLRFTVTATSDGEIDTGFHRVVTIAKVTGPGTLTGTLSAVATAGVATFTDVVYHATTDGETFSLAARVGDGGTDYEEGNTGALSSRMVANVLPTPATISIAGTHCVYTGGPQAVIATTLPPGLDFVEVTYDGTAQVPVHAGIYAVRARLVNPGYSAPEVTAQLVVDKAPATLTLSGLRGAYSDSPQRVSVETDPAGLAATTVTYDGVASPPTDAGTYRVVASLDNRDYQATNANADMVITKAPTITSATTSSGLVQVGEAVSLRAAVTAIPSSAGPPNGLVTFSDGTTRLGTATLHSGVASLDGVVLARGTHAITAYYAGSTNHTNSTSAVAAVRVNCPPNTTAATPSRSTLWPASHKMVDVGIAGITDPDGDTVAVCIDQITQDEAVNGAGDGDTSPDAAGLGTCVAQLRAERGGTTKLPGNGRVYTVWFTATDRYGGSSRGRVTVSVPRNQSESGSAIDDGQTVDSITGQSVAGIGKTSFAGGIDGPRLRPYPNPFNPSTTIAYDLAQAGNVRLRVYAASGQIVRELVAANQASGRYEVEWDGRDGNGVLVGNGVYLCELRAGDFRAVTRMVLMK